MSRLLFILILFLAAFSLTTCTKVSKKNPSFEGYWISQGSICEFHINISANNQGQYYNIGDKGCGMGGGSGTAKLDNHHLYINYFRFKIIEFPHAPSVDSVLIQGTVLINGSYSSYAYRKVDSEMTLRNGLFQGHETIKLFRVK